MCLFFIYRKIGLLMWFKHWQWLRINDHCFAMKNCNIRIGWRPLPLTNYNLHTAPTDPWTMQSPSHCSLPYPTWWRNTYVRMLFIDYSSAFNTMLPSNRVTKLMALGLNSSLCNWVLDFLTGRPQVVRVGNNTSVTLNTFSTQGPPRGVCYAQLQLN